MKREDGLRALAECRDRIDELDRRIIDLLSQRTRIVEEIGRLKQHLDLPIYEPKREEQVFENVTGHNPGPLTPDGVKRVFERIIDEMRAIQRLRMLERDGEPDSGENKEEGL
ncbi:MAG: chorismate mutase [Bryobacteraceae bacterium]